MPAMRSSGLESFIDWNAVKTLGWDASSYIFNPFINLTVTDSRYYHSEEANVIGHKVEFIPLVNIKTGFRFGYHNFLSSLQFTHLSTQYTDAQNSSRAEPGSSHEGIIGPIPSYSIMDLSLSYRFRQFKFETGINNLLNEKYFSRSESNGLSRARDYTGGTSEFLCDGGGAVVSGSN